MKANDDHILLAAWWRPPISEGQALSGVGRPLHSAIDADENTLFASITTSTNLASGVLT